jgi:hypothetical protein
MTRNRHTEEQIIAVLKDAQARVSVQDLCRKHGISDATPVSSRTISITPIPCFSAQIHAPGSGEFGQQGISYSAGHRFNPYTAHQN